MKNKGFTLIELMVVVVVIGILAAIAIPNYQQFMRKSKRTDAITALNGLQQAQAKLRANCRWYASAFANPSVCGDTAALTRVNYPATSDDGLYTISLVAANSNSNSYTATATAIATESQAGDTDCKTFVLTVNATNPNGVKTSINAAGTASDTDPDVEDDFCWH